MEIFASQGAPPVSTTPVENLPPASTTHAVDFAIGTAGVLNTGHKFATVVNNTGCQFITGDNNTCGKLPPVSMTLGTNNGNNIRLLTPQSELDGKNLSIC